MSQRVGDEVQEHALHVLRRAADVGQSLVELALEVNLPRPRFGLETAHAVGDERWQLRLAQLERERARVDSSELEQIVDQRRERPCLLAQRRQVLVDRGEAVLDRFEHRLDRRHRRAQIVTGPGDELTARVEQRLDVPSHRVESLADVRELARPLRRRPGRQLPAGKLLGRRLQATDAPRDPRPQQQRGGKRRRGRRGRDGEDLHVVVHVEHHQTAQNHRRER